MTTPEPTRLTVLRAALEAYRDGLEDDGPAWWFHEIVADLGHLWDEITPDDAAGFLDAVTHGIRRHDTEASVIALRLARGESVADIP
jgi:hypothetical protein